MCVVSWLWLSPSAVEFGTVGSRDAREQTVWLHADPYALLGVPWGSDHDALRRAYRKAARVRHPDAGSAEGSFEELQLALDAARGDHDADVTIEPTAGSWWSFCEFVRPTGRIPGRGAVVGLVFELHDLDAVPLRQAEDHVTVTYNGQALPLAIRYSRSGAALPVIRAKLASLVESAVLVGLCLTLIPFLALTLSVEGYFLAGGSAILFWLALMVTIALGYGALIAILAAAGKPLRYPHRTVTRLRGKVADRTALPRSPR
jgi:DnaJ-like protein